MNWKTSEEIAFLGCSNPATVNNAAVSSPWVPLTNARKVLFALIVGATDTTITGIKLQGATSAAGAGAADITGKTASDYAATDDNKQVLIDLDAAELTAANASFTHARLTATVGNGATGAIVTAVAIGAAPRYRPASDSNAASIKQLV